MGPVMLQEAFVTGVAKAIENDLAWHIGKAASEAMPDDSKELWRKATTGDQSFKVVNDAEQKAFKETTEKFIEVLPEVTSRVVMNGSTRVYLIEKLEEMEKLMNETMNQLKEDCDAKLAKAKAHYHELLELTKSTVKTDAVSVAKKVYDEGMNSLQKEYSAIQKAKEQAKMADTAAGKIADGIQKLDAKYQATWSEDKQEFIIDKPMPEEVMKQMTKLQASWSFHDKLSIEQQAEGSGTNEIHGLQVFILDDGSLSPAGFITLPPQSATPSRLQPQLSPQWLQHWPPGSLSPLLWYTG